jgi:hypothetical protein
MAPDERNERTDTSVGESPTDMPQQVMTCRSSCVRMVVDMASHSVVKNAKRGVWGGAWNRRKCLILLMHAWTGQKAGLPDRPRPMSSPRMPFF